MNTSESQFSEAESWQLIQQMIKTAKQDVRDDGFYFLLWGWLVLIASLSHYILEVMVGVKYAYSVWALMLIGIIATVYHSVQYHKKQRVRTYVERFIMNFWLALFIAIMIVLVGAAFKTGYQIAYPNIILIYGVGIFVSGSIFRFKPLIIGGIGSWIIAIIAFFVSFHIQLLLMALATLIGYLIPGYILKASFRHE